MSEIKFSPQQIQAILARDSALLLSAAAGSGKTAVLVERIIKLITDEKNPIDIDKILVVTFTKNAAQGMKDKIYKALKDKIYSEPENVNLKRQLNLLNNASITTVHSFCKDIITSNAYMLDSKYGLKFNIADETASDLMRQQAVTELINEYYERKDPVFYKLVESYSKKDDNGLISLIFDIYDFVISMPFYNKWLDDALSNLKNAHIEEQSLYIKGIISHTKMILNDLIHKYELALEVIDSDEALINYKEQFNAEYSALKKAVTQTKYDDIRISLIEAKSGYTRLKSAKKGADNFIPKSIRDLAKDEINNLCEKYFCSDLNEIEKENYIMLPVIEKLLELVKRFIEDYNALKIERNLIDFSDLEHMAIQALINENSSPSKIALAYQERFYEILVDEYQDTNDVQETIFSYVSKCGQNLFMVGDVKQSIYKFRHTRPEIFINKQNSFKEDENAKYRKIFLSKNFRCRSEIIDFVNCIFSKLMTVKSSNLDYKATEKLIAGASYEEAISNEYVTELLVSSKDGYEITNAELEGSMIANRISELIGEENFLIKDGDKKRRLKYSDITILIRSFPESVYAILDTIKGHGIPIIYDDAQGLFDTLEVKVILSYLRVIDNPYDDISLITVLRSAIYNLNDDELLNIRLSSPDKYFYDALKSVEKYSYIIDELMEYKKYSLKYPVSRLVTAIYQKTGICDIFGAYPDGEEKRSNLRMLKELTKGCEDTGFKGISSFISYVKEIIDKGSDVFVSKRLEDNLNAVKVMTIHKSKGLEFPVVILANSAKSFNKRDLSNKIVQNPDLGIGFNFVDPDKGFSYPSFIKNAIALQIDKESMAEELRILYVALTRAKEKLIITGSVDSIEKRIQKCCEFILNQNNEILFSDFLNMSSYLDMILASLLPHKSLAELRGLYLGSEFMYSCDTEIKLNVFNADGYLKSQEEQAKATQNRMDYIENLELPHDVELKIKQLTKFDYIGTKNQNIPQKISVSEALKKLDEDIESHQLKKIELYKPLFSDESKTNAAEKGSLIHYIFEIIDIDLIKSGKNIRDLINELKISDNNLINSIGEKEINDVIKFFESPIGRRLLSSNKIVREKPFLVKIPASKIYKEIETDDQIILQGVIDCYFIEQDGGVVLLDYKNTRKSDQSIIDTYKNQINLYVMALKKLLDVDVKESYIWNITKGKAILI